MTTRVLAIAVALLAACGGDIRPPISVLPDGGADAGTDGGVCFPETGHAGCIRLGAECGDLQAIDNCGTPRTFECGTACPFGEACGELAANQCDRPACTPREFSPGMCTEAAPRCGEAAFSDGCYDTVTGDCGACAGDAICSVDGYCCEVIDPANTTEERCKARGFSCGMVETYDRLCGRALLEDCGECPAGWFCNENHFCKRNP